LINQILGDSLDNMKAAKTLNADEASTPTPRSRAKKDVGPMGGIFD